MSHTKSRVPFKESSAALLTMSKSQDFLQALVEGHFENFPAELVTEAVKECLAYLEESLS